MYLFTIDDRPVNWSRYLLVSRQSSQEHYQAMTSKYCFIHVTLHQYLRVIALKSVSHIYRGSSISVKPIICRKKTIPPMTDARLEIYLTSKPYLKVRGSYISLSSWRLFIAFAQGLALLDPLRNRTVIGHLTIRMHVTDHARNAKRARIFDILQSLWQGVPRITVTASHLTTPEQCVVEQIIGDCSRSTINELDEEIVWLAMQQA